MGARACLELKPKIEETRWDPRKELELLKVWEEEKTQEGWEGKEIIVIDTPPPYASGKWHVGGAAHYAQIDMIARYFRLKGYYVLVPFYADRNGLPVEVQVEKAYGINAKEMASTPEGRRKFLELCRDYLDKAEADLVRIWKRLGCSFEYWKEGTDSPRYRTLTQRTFIDLFNRGLIYEAERPVRWCPRCGTTLAEAEIEYEERDDYIYYVKYKLADTGEDLVVATTRPELIPACAALVYNPQDGRYKGLAGRKAVAPIFGHEVVILEHPSVDMTFGTGLEMVCSYGDEDDVRLFRELGLKPKVIIDERGYMTSEAGFLAGLHVEEARKKVVEELEKRGLLVKKERIRHTIPVCWRCKTPLQIINRRELFLRQLDYREDLKRLIEKIEFRPEFHKKKLIDWIDSIAMDWPISRDRYYGTEIPLWRCTRCGSLLVPEPGRYYRPWEEDPPWSSCPVCGAPKEYLVGEKRVFDTWFDSSISMLYVTRWAEDKEFYEKASANVLRPQGEDIIRTWLYYTLLRVYQLTGRPAFRWIRVTGMGLDPKGRPMHKSLGNVIDPEPVIEKYGADAFRFWAASSAKLGYDYKYDEKKVITGRNFETKLWNLARFISSFPEPTSAKPTRLDEAFMALAQRYVDAAIKGYESLDVYEPAVQLYELAWNVFAAHYVELVKDRAYSARWPAEEREAAWYTLHRIFKTILVLLSPIMPFVTDYIFRKLYGVSVHRQRIPERLISGPDVDRLAAEAEKVIRVNNAVWSYKKQHGMRLSDALKGRVYVTDASLAPYLRDLSTLHKADLVIAERPPEGSVEIGEGLFLLSQ
ncbi:MAG: valine--tRNA ligase [Acidilobus sp.]